MSEPAAAAARPVAPIFVAGAGRSGTTLLRLMLNEHPDVAIPSESHFLAPLVNAFGDRVLTAAEVERAVDMVAASAEWQRDFGHTEAELRAAVAGARGPQTIGELVDRVFRLEVGAEPARWGDKTPANLFSVDALLRCFPHAQVVAIVRDPRDVYLSLVELGWFGRTTWDIGRYLARNGDLVAQFSGRYPRERFTVVRYEDLVLRTERTLRELCAVLDLPFVPAMETFFRNTAENVQPWELDIGIHKKLLRPPAPDDVGRWRREASRRARFEIEALTDRVMDAHGYERELPSWALPAVRWEARVRHHAVAPRALLRRVGDRKRRRARTPVGDEAR